MTIVEFEVPASPLLLHELFADDQGVHHSMRELAPGVTITQYEPLIESRAFGTAEADPFIRVGFHVAENGGEILAAVLAYLEAAKRARALWIKVRGKPVRANQKALLALLEDAPEDPFPSAD